VTSLRNVGVKALWLKWALLDGVLASLKHLRKSKGWGCYLVMYGTTFTAPLPDQPRHLKAFGLAFIRSDDSFIAALSRAHLLAGRA